MSHADRFASKLAHCRGIRRIHLRSNMSTRVQAPGRHIRLICAWLITRANNNLNLYLRAFFINGPTNLRIFYSAHSQISLARSRACSMLGHTFSSPVSAMNPALVIICKGWDCTWERMRVTLLFEQDLCKS